MKRMRWFLLAILALVMLGTGLPVLADSGAQGAVFGGDFVLEEGQVHDDDLVVLGGTAHLKQGSVVDGDLAVMGGQVIVEGSVLGNVVSFGGSLTLGESALVEGDVIALAQLNRLPGATVEGKLVQGLESPEARDQLTRFLGALPESIRGRIESLPARPDAPEAPERPEMPERPTPVARPSSPLGNALRRLGTMVTLLLVALVVMSLLPSHMEQIETFMASSWSLSLGVGVLSIVLGSLLIPLLVVICIGLPVAIVLGLALVLAALMGWVAAGKFLASWVLPKLKIEVGAPVTQAIIGTFVLTLLAMIPCVGSVFGGLVLSWALGAVVLTRFGLRSDAQWIRGHVPGSPAASADATDLADDEGPAEPATPTGPLVDPSPDTRRLLADELDDQDLEE